MAEVRVQATVDRFNHLTVETTIDNGLRIETISRQIMNLQDQAVRDALIMAGWTPPKGPQYV